MKLWILTIVLFFCVSVVDAQTKIVLENNKSLNQQITVENCIYVIKNDFILNGDLMIPANCVLEFEGGNVFGNHNIFLGRNCKIIGHGIEEIKIGGAIYLNHKAYIGNINLVRNTSFNNAEESFVIISDEHIRYPNDGDVNTNIILDNVTINYFDNKHYDYGNAVEIVSGNGNTNDRSHYKGMYNFTFSNVYVNGYFNGAFYIHALEDGWITALTFDRCFIERCTTGWKIDSYSSAAIEQVNITNCGIQNCDWSKYAVDCGKAELYVNNFRTWDWWNNHNVGSPFRFTEETRKTFIDVLHESRKYDLDSEHYQFNNNIHVDNWTYDRDIERIIDLKHGFVKLITLYTLPNGTYRIPQDKVMINALGIDANVLGGTMVVSGGMHEKLLTFVSNYTRKERVVATLAFYQTPPATEFVDYDVWTYSLTTPTLSGQSSDRPVYANETWCKGRYFFDTDLGKPIWWNGLYWVDADGKRITYPIAVYINDMDLSYKKQPDVCTSYTNKLIAKKGFKLPANITIRMNNIALKIGTEYTYNSSTGEFKIFGFGGSGGVTGDITIIADAIKGDLKDK